MKKISDLLGGISHGRSICTLVDAIFAPGHALEAASEQIEASRETNRTST